MLCEELADILTHQATISQKTSPLCSDFLKKTLLCRDFVSEIFSGKYFSKKKISLCSDFVSEIY
jgi:hypothetical protein